MKKLTIIIAMVLVSGGLLFLGGCRHEHKDIQGRIGFAIDYLDEVLDLDQAQQAKLEAIRKELMPHFLALQKSRKEMHPMFREQLASETIDTEVVRQAISEHSRKFSDVIDLCIDRFAEFHAMLSPEQRQKLLAKLDKFEKWHNYQEIK